MALITSGDADEDCFKLLNCEMRERQAALDKLRAACGGKAELNHRMSRINRALELEQEVGTSEYDDNPIRYLIDTIRVVSGNKLKITFGTGYEYEQRITPNIGGDQLHGIR